MTERGDHNITLPSSMMENRPRPASFRELIKIVRGEIRLTYVEVGAGVLPIVVDMWSNQSPYADVASVLPLAFLTTWKPVRALYHQFKNLSQRRRVWADPVARARRYADRAHVLAITIVAERLIDELLAALENRVDLLQHYEPGDLVFVNTRNQPIDAVYRAVGFQPIRIETVKPRVLVDEPSLEAYRVKRNMSVGMWPPEAVRNFQLQRRDTYRRAVAYLLDARADMRGLHAALQDLQDHS